MKSYLFVYGQDGCDEALTRVVSLKPEELPALQLAWTDGGVFFGEETFLDLRPTPKYWPISLLLVDDDS
ncbi:MAG: hypothetical protein ACYTFV_00905 [Planctomycetota bacterium]|jgi:hypothetical protein